MRWRRASALALIAFSIEHYRASHSTQTWAGPTHRPRPGTPPIRPRISPRQVRPLTTPQDNIFDLVYVKPSAAKPDEIAERQVCAEFEKFKPLFEQCVREMAEGKRKAIPFANEQEIGAGEFFILNGVLVYVAEVGETHVRNGKKNARLRRAEVHAGEHEPILDRELFEAVQAKRAANAVARKVGDRSDQERRSRPE
jgi:hypothetical protein